MSRQTFIGWAVGSCFLALAGPFGTYEDMTLWERTLFWTGICALGILTAYTVHALGRALLPLPGRFPVMTAEATGFASLFTPVLLGFVKLFPDDPAMPPSHPILQIWLYCFVAFSLVWISREWLVPATEPLRHPRLHERLDLAGDVRIVRLMAEDHHVIVFASDGTRHRLRMRLADAVREMDGVWGAYVHRSHWVDFEQIREVGRERRRHVLVMFDGAKVPVSRTYRAELVDAGFLPEPEQSPAAASARGQRAGP